MKEKTKGMEIKVQDLRKLQLRLVVTYAAVILIAVTLVAVVLINKSSDTLTNKVGSLMASTNTQLKLNVDRYEREIEEAGMLIFTEEKYYTYDAASKDMNEYQHLQMQEEITARLLEISMTKNFSDFGIVYRNGDTIGRVSEGTKKQYRNKLFGAMESSITDEVRKDGWCIGYTDDYERLYYIKKLNENAILVTAVYTTELSNIFTDKESVENMESYYLTEDGHVIYTDERKNIGTQVDSEIMDMVEGKERATVKNGSYLVATDLCDQGWRVLCVMTTSSLMQDTASLIHFSVLVAIATIIISISASMLLSRTVTNPITGIVSGLNEEASVDKMTGALRRPAFENAITRKILENPQQKIGFLLLDIDDFKSINDTYGHVTGDAALAYTGYLLCSYFRENDLVARLGGDEFAVGICMNQGSEFKDLEKRVDQFFTTQHPFRDPKLGVIPLTYSAGLCMYPVDADSYDVLYAEADRRLYEAKRKGKNQFISSQIKEEAAHEE